MRRAAALLIIAIAAAAATWWFTRSRPPLGEAAAESVAADTAPSAGSASKSAKTLASLVPRPTRASVRIGDGTKVRLVLLEDLSSATAQAGDRVPLKVASDVRIEGIVAVARGAEGSGTVADVEKKRFFRRTPKLTVRMSYVQAADGESIRLRAAERAEDRGTSADIVDLGALLGQQEKGKDIVALHGTEVVAYVDEDKVLKPEGASPGR